MFTQQIEKIREQEEFLANQTIEFFEENRLRVAKEIESVVMQIKEKHP